MAAFLKMLTYWTHAQVDIRYEKIVPNYARTRIFMVMTSSMTSQADMKVALHIPVLGEIGSWSKFVAKAISRQQMQIS